MARIGYSEQIKDKATKALVEALTTVGWQVAMEAYRRKTYTNRTFNLHDSYGSAVYVDGVLQPDTKKYVNRSRSKRNDVHGHIDSDNRYAPYGLNGRRALDDFFDNLKISKRRKVTLVVAAAMWYGELVESKGFIVLDEKFVENAVQHRLAFVLPPILAKYPELKGIDPKLFRYVGVDEEYYTNQEVYDRKKSRR
jgi:hypothetical protein